jgi:hypothetical protein
MILFWTMRSRDHDVVLVRRKIDLRCWEFGMGRGWEGVGQFTSNLGQGGRDRITPRRVSK